MSTDNYLDLAIIICKMLHSCCALSSNRCTTLQDKGKGAIDNLYQILLRLPTKSFHFLSIPPFKETDKFNLSMFVLSSN